MELKIGTPPQTFNVLVDTGNTIYFASRISLLRAGSQALWVGSVSSSSTFKDTSSGQESTIEYGSGTITGYNAEDTVTVGSFVLSNQDFILVNYEDSIIQEEQNGTYDGIVGLLWEGGVVTSVSGSYYPTIVDNMITSGLISNPMFSIWLTGSTGDILPTGGEILFGASDSTRYTGSLASYSVPSAQAYWGLSVSDVSVGSHSAVAPSSSTVGIVDCGTSLIYIESTFLSENILPAIYTAAGYSSVPSLNEEYGAYVLPCSKRTSLPDVSFYFGDSNGFALSWYDYVLPITSTECFIGLMPQSGDGSYGSDDKTPTIALASTANGTAAFWDVSEKSGTSTKTGGVRSTFAIGVAAAALAVIL
ncbi:hypothetical protein HDU82_004443 [Entophlyctis luteolus]|nr:hypothetical protein HDU82_004443 [Entophlyctis luteolus]